MDLVLSPIETRFSVGTPMTTVGGLTTPSGSLTTLVAEAGGPTATLGSLTARPQVALWFHPTV
jgi:hypothetical protein